MPAIIEYILEKCSLALGNKIKNITADSDPISISDVRLAQVLPRRFLLKMPLNNSDICSLDYEAFNNDYKAICDSEKRWINSCELNFRINNIHSSKSLSVLGIHFDYRVIELNNISSFLEIPQGDYEFGEAAHFACCFVGDRFTCQHYEIMNHRIKLLGDIDYFETSTIDISSNRSCNLNLSLISNCRSIEINQISIIYRLRDNKAIRDVKCLDIPLKKPILIIALKDVPEDQRYRLTWKPNPPIITLESDNSILASYEEKCRWDDYPDEVYF